MENKHKELERIYADIIRKYNYEIQANYIYVNLQSNNLHIDFLDDFWLKILIKNNMFYIEYSDKKYKNCTLEVVNYYIEEFKKLYDNFNKIKKTYEDLDHASIVSKVRKKKIKKILKEE